MNISYPSGSDPTLHFAKEKQKKQGTAKKPVTYGKRGMNLEEAINESNEYYLAHQLAVVHKKPTPLQIVKVDYPKRSAAVIREAYFRQASTTDYNGVYQGHYLDFEAKETKNKTSFPLKNFHQHQIDHFAACLTQGGLCFSLLYFSSLHRCFFLEAAVLIDYWQKKAAKSSIPLKELEQKSIELTPGIAPRIPYLQAVAQTLTKEDPFHE